MSLGGKLIAPWSEKVRYASKKNGYHGGLTPQECVVPLALLCWHTTIPDTLEALPLFQPGWWLLDRQETAVAAAPSAPDVVATRFTKSGQAEMSFRPVPTLQTWIDRLFVSHVFARQLELAGRSAPKPELIRRFLAALDERGGTILRKALAQKLGEPEFRIPGLIAAMRRIFNVDGYAVLSVDEPSDSVILNRQLLGVQFEMSEREATDG
jgi:hypothetical protein